MERSIQLTSSLLESRVKIDQLLALFACELRDGRPAAAPLMRREGRGQFETQHPDEDGLKAIGEAEIHDRVVLPHHYAQRDIDVLLPNIVPPPQDDFGERDLAGRDPALVDPINEPYVIRAHRPH